jgi:hypothetical protein
VRDVTDLSGTGPIDLVTAFDAIHDQAHPAAVLAGIAASLAADGVFLMCDIRASSHPHENVGLPGAAWGEQTAVRMLREAGLARIEVKGLDGDFINSYYVARP